MGLRGLLCSFHQGTRVNKFHGQSHDTQFQIHIFQSRDSGSFSRGVHGCDISRVFGMRLRVMCILSDNRWRHFPIK